MSYPNINNFGFRNNPLLFTPFVSDNVESGSNHSIFGVRVTENVHDVRVTETGEIRVIETQAPDNSFLLLSSFNFLLLSGDNFNLL